MCEWRPIPSTGGVYEASSDGQIRRGTRVLKQSRTTAYPQIVVSLGGRVSRRYVHALVAEAFHGPRPPGQEVNHRDGDKNNNRADNLEWTTRSANGLHAYANGLNHPSPVFGEKHGRTRLTEADVLAIRAAPATVTTVELARRFGIARSTASGIRKGLWWRTSDELAARGASS